MQTRLGDILPTIRIVNIKAADIYFAKHFSHKKISIKNKGRFFDDRFKDLMPCNLDLLYLKDVGMLTLEQLGEELYSFDFVNVSFDTPLFINQNNEKTRPKNGDVEQTLYSDVMRKDIYLNGFKLNGNDYVRYKRSAGSAKSGSCLFVKKNLYNILNSWSKTGLNEEADHCLDNLTSYEAYRALSLSSLIKTLRLNPYNILFVKDFETSLKDQEVIKVSFDGKENLVASKETCEVTKINVFDGEGLLDVSVFNECGYIGEKSKGMMLLRNRFFKCCAFNTNLQAWFKKNRITSVSQLTSDNKITFAKSIEDIVLVVSESCLKYFKLVKGKKAFTKENIKRWCDAIVDDDNTSLFGIVKTDKETRFFDGNMVETTYQLLNTLQLKPKHIRLLLADYVDYINKIRNIKNTPEYAKFYLQGELKENDYEDYDDDSEGQEEDDDFFDYSSYSFKTKICFDLLNINKEFVKTDMIKNHLFNNIIDSFRLKLYDGRILVDGTYATLFGNPLEFLQYILNEENRVYKFNEKNILNENEIYCSFFKNKEELVGSRAPHIVMGNILYARNKELPEVKTWFNLTRNIVVVDALKNNIQQRLNGADYDSDSMLLTNNKIIVAVAYKNYEKFPVPYAAFESNKKEYSSFEEAKNKKENKLLNLYTIDETIANNKTGEIVNLSQKLNSHLWNKLNGNARFDYEELYNQIAILAVLAGAEIDSSKRTFDFTTETVLKSVKKYAKDNGYKDSPMFFYYVAKKEKPKAGNISQYLKDKEENGTANYYKTTMDYLWQFPDKKISAPNIKTVKLFKFLDKNIGSKGLNYKQKDKVIENLTKIMMDLKLEKLSRKKSTKYDLERRDFAIQIEDCYGKIENGIDSLKKIKKLIKEIEKEKTPYSLCYILLYILYIKKKDLYDQLFVNDGGIDSLERVKNKKAEFQLFNNYFYQRAPLNKFLRIIENMKEAKK